MKERNVTCASAAVHGQLFSHALFHIHSNYTYITGLVPELHNFQFADKQYSP